MTRWDVMADGRGWAVVKVSEDGSREEVRARWTNLACIDAQVIAEELNRAYVLGREEVFAVSLAD